MGEISSLTISLILGGASASVSIPLLLCAIFKKRFKAHIKPFLLGIVSYLALSFCLVNIVNGILGSFINATEFSTAFIFVYSLCTQIIAAIIAQCGKYYTIRILKNDKQQDKFAMMGDAMQFGIGYGGAECVITLGITLLSYMMYAGIFLSGSVDAVYASLSGEELAYTQEIFRFLTENGAENLIVLILQGLALLAFQLGSSMLVHRAVYGPNDKAYLTLAIVFHVIMLVPECIVSAGIITNMWFKAITTVIFGAAVLYYAFDKIKEYEKRHIDDRIKAQKGKKNIHLK